MSEQASYSGQSSRRGSRGFAKAFIAVVAIAVVAFGLPVTPVGASPQNKVLILTESVRNGASSPEATYLAAQGFTVEFLAGASWQNQTTAYFAEFRALVVGDTGSTPSVVYTSHLANSKELWSPAVTGNVFIAGADPVDHGGLNINGSSGAATLIRNGLSYAVNDEENTGLYLTTSDQFPSAASSALSGLGAGWSGEQIHRNPVHVVASHPVTTGLTDASLSNWGYSVHYRFLSWPTNFFPLAINVDSAGPWSGADGVKGYPYILVRGEANLEGYNPSVPETFGDTEFGTDVADPVSTAYGNYHDTYVDLPATAGLYGMTIERGYNSLDSTVGAMGVGWRTPYSDTAEFSGGVVTLTRADGRRIRYLPDGSSGWVQPLGFNGVLSQDLDGSYRVDFPEGESWLFDTTGRLEQRELWDGQYVSIARDGSGRVTSATSSSGPSVTFVYGTSGPANGRIVSVASSDGRSVIYGYGGPTSSLASVTNPAGGTTLFETDSLGRITKVTDPSGVVVAETTYDPTSGRVSEQTTPQGTITLSYDYSENTTTVTHVGLDQTIVYLHDEQGRVVRITDQDNEFMTRSYGSEGYPLGTVTQTGQETSLGRNAKGLPTSIVDPEMGTSTLTYDAFDRVSSVSSPIRGVTTFTYENDTSRVPKWITDQYAKTTTNVLSGSLIVATTDPDGVTTAFTHNSNRQVTSVTDEFNNVTEYGYDSAGRLNSTLSPEGRESSTVYDGMGRPVTKTASDGGVVSYTYDAAGRQLTMTDQLLKVATATYDPVTGLLASTQLPGKPATTYTYDPAGRLKEVTDPTGVVTKTFYDDLGRVSKTVDGAGRETLYGYDIAGRLTSTTAPDAGIWQTFFNAKGQVAETQDGEGRSTEYEYWANGLPKSVEEPGGGTSSYTYDLMGRLLSETDPTGVIRSVTYTNAGRVKTLTKGGVTTTFGYDDAGRYITATDARGTAVTGYTDDGLIDFVTSREGLTTSYDYDDVGRISERVDPSGVVSTYTWTLRGELKTAHVTGRGIIANEYNDDGTVAAVENQFEEITSFGYDNAGRLISRTSPLGTESWTYSNGELASYTPVPVIGQPAGVETYGRDAAGRINSVVDGAGRVHSTVFDKSGAMTSQIDTDGATVLTRAYEYDTAGRQWKVTTPEGDTTRTFDAAGRLASSTDPSGATTVWGYDAFGRTSSLEAPDGTALTYGYDNAGRLSQISGPESTTMTDNFTGSDTPPDPNKWTTTMTGTSNSLTNTNVMVMSSDWGGGSVRLRSQNGPTRDSDQSASVVFLSTSEWFQAFFNVTARTQSNGDGYRIQVRSDAWNAQIIKRVNGQDTTLGTVGVPLGSPIRVRLAVDGTTIKAKAWEHGHTEPTAWGFTTHDASITASGNNDVTYSSNTINNAAVDDYTGTSNPSSTTFVEYSYDNDDKVLSADYATGSREYTYNLTGQLASVEQTLPGATNTTAYTYNSSGSIASTAVGGISTAYSYDQAGQLTGVTPSSGPGVQSFTYEYGRVTTASVDGITTTNTFDDRSRLLSAVPSVGPATTYSYNGAGDRTSETTGSDTLSYSYDPAGRLTTTQHIESSSVVKTVTRGYNAEGLLSGYDVSGPGASPAESYGMSWDHNRGVAQPLQFLVGSDPFDTTTVVSDGSGPVSTVVDNVAVPVAVDGFGSVVGSSGQNVNYAGGYDVWGRAVSPSVSDAPSFGFRGELTVDDQIYLRNRIYDPNSRLFTTVDPLGPVAGTPTVATLYHYVDNDPVNLVDPLGLAPMDRNPMDDSWRYLEADNGIGTVVDFLEGILAQAFGNVWGAVTGVVGLGGEALSCAGEKLNNVPLLGRLIPDSASCDGIEETIGAIKDFGAEVWTSISQLFTHHDAKALTYFIISVGELLTGSNMGDCLLTPYDKHDNYRTYAYCMGTFIGGGLVTLVSAGLTKAGLAKLKNQITKKVDDAINTPRGLGGGARFVANSAGDVLDTTRIAIPQGKFGYLLNNPSKSGVFSDSMGFTEGTLGPALRGHLVDNFGTATRSVPMVGGGTKFSVTGPLTGPSGQKWNITTAWGVDPDGTVRLITATP